jgi:hypothetical protein
MKQSVGLLEPPVAANPWIRRGSRNSSVWTKSSVWIPACTGRSLTDGCVAVTDRLMDEIWRAVPDGTKIILKP